MTFSTVNNSVSYWAHLSNKTQISENPFCHNTKFRDHLLKCYSVEQYNCNMCHVGTTVTGQEGECLIIHTFVFRNTEHNAMKSSLHKLLE